MGRSRPVLPRATALPTAKSAVKVSKAIESALKTDLCDGLVGFRKQTKLLHFVNVSAGGVIQWIGDHFSADFYVEWLGLSLEEEEELHVLNMDDECLETIVSDYAPEWRNRQKATTPVPLIRRLILQRSAMLAVKCTVDCKCSYRVELAFALWLCERAEHRAQKLEKAGFAAE